jgi:hypothetical protein
MKRESEAYSVSDDQAHGLQLLDSIFSFLACLGAVKHPNQMKHLSLLTKNGTAIPNLQ